MGIHPTVFGSVEPLGEQWNLQQMGVGVPMTKGNWQVSYSGNWACSMDVSPIRKWTLKTTVSFWCPFNSNKWFAQNRHTRIGSGDLEVVNIYVSYKLTQANATLVVPLVSAALPPRATGLTFCRLNGDVSTRSKRAKPEGQPCYEHSHGLSTCTKLSAGPYSS